MEARDDSARRSGTEVEAGLPGLVRALMGLNRVLMHSWHRVTVAQAPTPGVPRVGAMIIAPVHTAGLDPLAIQAVLGRRVRWMMAAEYFETPMLGGVFHKAGVIAVKRDGHDSAATRAALRALAGGELLGIFPEGKIEVSRRLLPLERGIGVLASHAQVPVLPVWIDGTQRGKTMLGGLLSPNDVKLMFGRAISPCKPAEVLKELENQYRDLQTLSALSRAD